MIKMFWEYDFNPKAVSSLIEHLDSKVAYGTLVGVLTHFVNRMTADVEVQAPCYVQKSETRFPIDAELDLLAACEKYVETYKAWKLKNPS